MGGFKREIVYVCVCICICSRTQNIQLNLVYIGICSIQGCRDGLCKGMAAGIVIL